MHHPTDRITHTTAFVTPVVEHWLEREIALNESLGHTCFVFTISFYHIIIWFHIPYHIHVIYFIIAEP